jgi:hypothetical protein
MDRCARGAAFMALLPIAFEFFANYGRIWCPGWDEDGFCAARANPRQWRRRRARSGRREGGGAGARGGGSQKP